MSTALYRFDFFRPVMHSVQLCLFTSLALPIFGTASMTAQAAPSANDLVATMVAHEDYEAEHKGNYIYLSKERSERTGGHLWTERVAEVAAGKIRMLIAEDDVPLAGDRKSKVITQLDDIAAHPDVFQKSEESRKNDETRAKQMLDLLPKAFIFSNVRPGGGCLRIDFQPNPNYTPQSMEERVLHAMIGSIAINPSQGRLCELTGRLPDDLKIGFGLIATVHGGSSFSTTRIAVPGNEWKTAVIDTDIAGRAIFFKSIGKKEHAQHTAFQPIPRGTTVAQAVRMLEAGSTASASSRR